MDLKAYTQIDDLQNLAKVNNITVPRLRGYRLMSEEKPVSEEKIKEMMQKSEIEVCHSLCCTYPTWNLNIGWSEWNPRTERKVAYYLAQNVDEEGLKRYDNIRWDRIHGWKRRVLKFEIKKKKKRVRKQFETWNKYAGRADVLYIHARIGGKNWIGYGGNELEKQPWFLEKVDDCFDGTYCDIYTLLK